MTKLTSQIKMQSEGVNFAPGNLSQIPGKSFLHPIQNLEMYKSLITGN